MIIRNIFQKILDRIKSPKVIGTEYDDSPFERCVMCGKLTTVRKDTHLDYGFSQLRTERPKQTTTRYAGAR